MPPRRPWALVNWLFWASLLLYPLFQFLISMVSSGSSVTLASLALIFCMGECRAKWSQHVWQGPHVRPGVLLAGSIAPARAGPPALSGGLEVCLEELHSPHGVVWSWNSKSRHGEATLQTLKAVV